MKQFISNNGGMLAVLAVVGVILAAYAEWRIGEAVSAKIDAVTLQQISPDKIEAIEGDIKEVRTQHSADSERMDSKIERIVDILLEE